MAERQPPRRRRRLGLAAVAALCALACLPGAAIAAARWMNAPHLLWTPIYPSATTVGDDIYVVGSDQDGTSDFQRFDADTGVWTRLPNDPHYPYRSLDSAVQAGDDGKVYLLGGGGDDLRGSAVYDPATNAWARIPPMPVGQIGAVARTAGKLYVIGGYGASNRSTARVQTYDPATRTWGRAAPLPWRRDGLAVAVTADGRIVAAGGLVRCCTAKRTVAIYDPASNTWRRGAPMPVGVDSSGAALGSGDRVFVVGGEIDGRHTRLVQVYSPVTDSWSPGPRLPDVRAFAPAARVSQGRIYAIAGEAQNGCCSYPVDTMFVLDSRVGSAALARRGDGTERVSVSSTGAQGDRNSWDVSLSAGARYTAFSSVARNLVADDTARCHTDGGEAYSCQDVFVRDRQAGLTERDSLSSGGEQGDGDSFDPKITPDGRFVVFTSAASNLVPGDTNRRWDVFVRDRLTGTTERVSVASDGAQADADSDNATISDDGRYVAFQSDADNLVANDRNGSPDVFVYDRATARLSLITKPPRPDQEVWGDSPRISGNGRFVAFGSSAPPYTALSFQEEVFVADRRSGDIELVSADPTGAPGRGFSQFPTISRTGRYIAFCSDAALLPGLQRRPDQCFVRDRRSRTTILVSVDRTGAPGDAYSFSAVVTPDGRQVAFVSRAGNLVPGDSNRADDLFVWDRAAASVHRLNLTPTGAQSPRGLRGMRSVPAIRDGFVGFDARADDLVAGDTNDADDVFLTPTG